MQNSKSRYVKDKNNQNYDSNNTTNSQQKDENIYDKDNRIFKVDNITGSYSKTQYCIFRVGRKFHDSKSVFAFQYHMERQKEIPNADMITKNIRLVGSKDIADDLENYLKDVKIRKNNVLARELLLTASPEFFKGIPPQQLQSWINTNVEWLNNEFGDNIIYAVLHLDESTPHIHCLMCPKIYDEKRKVYRLSNRFFFNGKELLSQWQDNYASCMNKTFPILKRGRKYSKAKHIEIREYYSVVNQQLDISDFGSVVNKAKNCELVEQNNEELQKTLDIVSDKYSKREQKMLNAIEDLKGVEKESKLYRDITKVITNKYKVNEKELSQIIKAVNEFEKQKGK